MTAEELELGIANILDDMRTEWIEGLLPKLTAFVTEREQAAYRRALEDAAANIQVEAGPLAKQAVGGEYIVECAVKAFRNGLLEMAAPDPREAKD